MRKSQIQLVKKYGCKITQASCGNLPSLPNLDQPMCDNLQKKRLYQNELQVSQGSKTVFQIAFSSKLDVFVDLRRGSSAVEICQRDSKLGSSLNLFAVTVAGNAILPLHAKNIKLTCAFSNL